MAPDAAPAPPALARLKQRSDFVRLAKAGRKAVTQGLVLQAMVREEGGPPRLGFTVTKKVGNAVIRNRTRRRLKEAARLLLRDHTVSGVDLVVIGRDGTRARAFAELMSDLRRALSKVGVL